MDFNAAISQIRSRELLDNAMLELTLFLYNNPFIARNLVDEILTKFNNFISNFFIPHLQNEINVQMYSKADSTLLSKMKFILDSNKDLFYNLSTEYHRLKMYADKRLYIPPELIEISQKKVSVNSTDAQANETEKPAYVAHVSIENSLRKILEIPGIFNEIVQYVDQLSKEKIFLSNIIQADLWVKKYSCKNKLVFPIYMYFDEFETRDPLKSHAGNQKLGGVYGSLACLPPHLIGKSQNTFLISVFYSKYLKKFGNDAVFRSSINSINKLSTEGIKIIIDNIEKTVFFDCILILGDNAGLNSICGFSKSFSAKMFCRICTATSDQCQCMLVENDKLLRSADSYDDSVLKKNYELFGVSEPCIFNKLSKFHIVENITVDVMHDLCEGVAGYTISKVLQALIETKVVTLEQINIRIKQFEYGNVESGNKPQPLFFTYSKKGKKKLKIKQSASELVCLTRYLGVIIGDLIPSKNEFWKLYIYLRQIVGLLTSPRLTRGQVINLKEVILKHNSYYIRLFEKLKPKMHLLTHYPRVILMNGPPIHYSSLKFERKNRKLKEMVIGITSNVNLPLTVAIRNQLQLSYVSLKPTNLKTDVELGSIKKNQLKIFIPRQFKEANVKSLHYVNILGQKYSAGSVCITRFLDDGPEFGIIKEIVLDSPTIYFQIITFTTKYFNRHYYAYSVVTNVNTDSKLIDINELPRSSPCLMVTINEENFIVTRYNL